MSLAFPLLAAVRDVVYSPPIAVEWLREEEAYRRYGWLTPQLVAQLYVAELLLVARERHSGTVWVRPASDSWDLLLRESGAEVRP